MRVPEVVLVTGGSRGIGAATARLLATRGARVAVNYRAAVDAAQAVVAEVERRGARGFAVRCDVSDEAQVLAMFDAVERTLGPIGGLVNSAGITGAQSRLEAMGAARIERVFAVNCVGTLLCAREGARRMSQRNGGAGGVIVNVSSGASRIGSPGEFVDYAASKGAIDTLTLGLAKELAPDGIRVAAVRPGLIDTDIHATMGEPDRVARMLPSVPMGRAGSAEEVAQAIAWLLSEASSFSTGAIIDVAGGR